MGTERVTVVSPDFSAELEIRDGIVQSASRPLTAWIGYTGATAKGIARQKGWSVDASVPVQGEPNG